MVSIPKILQMFSMSDYFGAFTRISTHRQVWLTDINNNLIKIKMKDVNSHSYTISKNICKIQGAWLDRNIYNFTSNFVNISRIALIICNLDKQDYSKWPILYN